MTVVIMENKMSKNYSNTQDDGWTKTEITDTMYLVLYQTPEMLHPKISYVYDNLSNAEKAVFKLREKPNTLKDAGQGASLGRL